MNYRRLIISILVVAVGIAAFFMWKPPTVGPFEGNRLPDFSIMDRQGQLQAYDAFQGKPLVINFWATWCEPCKAEMPMFDRVYKAADGSFRFIAVTDEPLPVGKRFFNEYDLSLPLFIDVDRSMHQDYLIRGMPTTYFVGTNGIITGVYMGEMSEELFLAHLKNILPETDYHRIVSAF